MNPCVVKGCPWRGSDAYACPMHDSDTAWDVQWMLHNGIPLKHTTRRS